MLVVAAHPDDEILGCGGTVSRLVKEGHEAFTLILGEGIISRADTRDREKKKEELSKLKDQAKRANRIIGIKEVFFSDLPDNRFDTIALLDVVKAIERIKNRVKPHTIYTHYKGDLNIDHQITYNAVIAATRPMAQETVREIYAFETLSSTEWNYPLTFSPDLFFDITEVLDIKLKAMKCYTSELRKFPHPRSLKGMELNAAYWGMRLGTDYVEAFESVRVIR